MTADNRTTADGQAIRAVRLFGNNGTPLNGSEATNHSGTITAGGTAQDLMGANSARNGWLIQNQSAGVLWIRSKGASGANVAAATQDSLEIPAGSYYESPRVSGNALSIFGATTGQAFHAEEW